ncbi:hypothetical protein L2E82_45829 [Cichorium intybus]|uniref:Uncharacterized protein n=1 Tax=Cichorium intybus TaxID=13427 RepID=A0ACB8ZTZ5_CICIN|nr:hypothetical protein L2E82_45829 [Cichorium intybus]
MFVANPEDEKKDVCHCSIQEKLENELKELDKRLKPKEAEMKRVAGGDTSVLKQHYEKKVQDLEHEKRALQYDAAIKDVNKAFYKVVPMCRDEVREQFYQI